MFSEDTTPEIRQRLIDGYRAMSAANKLQCVAELSEVTKRQARELVRSFYGVRLTEREVVLKTAALYISRDTILMATGYDPGDVEAEFVQAGVENPFRKDG